MKKIFNASLLAILLTNITIFAYSQGESAVDEENYVKSNVAVTKFKILGISEKQYAKCLESINFENPEKKLRFTTIGKTDFADDGRNYDLIANDGILTSTSLFTYTDGTEVIQKGLYQNGASHDAFAIDEAFAHQAEIGSAGKFKVTIGCKFKWVPCSQMTNPGQQYLCNWAGWPHGSFQITECEIKFEF